MNTRRGHVRWIVVEVSLLVSLACLLLGACTFPQALGQDEPPSVTINEPASGASVVANSYLYISASASGGNPITRVELWMDGELVGTQDSGAAGGISPFDVSFELLVPPGDHTLFVRAVNAAGLMENSSAVNVSAVENPSAGAEATASPSAPMPTNTPAPPATESHEPVEIPLLAREGRVAGNTPVVLRFGWETDTSEQVADFLGSVDLVVSLDGEAVPDAGDYWSEVRESGGRDENGEPNYLTVWLYEVGVLSTGTHRVEAELRFQRPVTDGFDSDGDGAPEEYSGTMPFSLPIVVGE
ncbi:MAG TPA: Ig-like domain-containing protein [Anaerolineae bacterium]|nr:Ig-like domain-containing protein [Anaerolineae bacterium]